MKAILSLNRRPWLFTLVFVLFWVMFNILVVLALRLIPQSKVLSQVPVPWAPLLSHVLTVFIVAPFLLGFPGKEIEF